MATHYDQEQKSVLDRLGRFLRKKHASPKETKAAEETVLVETDAREMRGGDRDSTGAFQQRPSQGWGPAGESLETDAGQFLAAARKGGDYSGSAGKLAQSVQRSAFPDRYDQRGAEADRLRRGGQGPSTAATSVDRGTPTAPPSADAQGLRRQALQQYLVNRDRDPDALLGLASGLKEAKAAGQAAPAPADARTGLTTRRQTSSSSAGHPTVNFATQRIGDYAESVAPNRGPQLDTLEKRFGLAGEPWCAMFATTAAAHGGASRAVRTPSVAEINRWAREGSHGYEKGLLHGEKAQPGDLMTFGDRHVGVVEKVDRGAGTITTIEGNTSDGKVKRVTRSVTDGMIARPSYG